MPRFLREMLSTELYMAPALVSSDLFHKPYGTCVTGLLEAREGAMVCAYTCCGIVSSTTSTPYQAPYQTIHQVPRCFHAQAFAA